MPVVIQYTKKAWKERSALTQNALAVLVALEEDLRQTDGKPFGGGGLIWDQHASIQATPTTATLQGTLLPYGQ